MTRSSEPSIGIIGRIPPPFGGVSVHLNRLLPRLREHGIAYNFYDLDGKTDPAMGVRPASASLSWAVRFLLTCRERLVHMHTNAPALVCAAAALLPSRGRIYVLTIHGATLIDWYTNASRPARWLFRKAACRITHVVAVSDSISAWLQSLGLPQDRISVKPAFIPPSEAEVSDSNLDDGIRDFIASHQPVIASHGWFGWILNGGHIYGFDLLLSLLEALRPTFPKLGIVTLVSGSGDEQHRKGIMEAREKQGFESSWMLIERPIHAAAVYAQCDLFVRPTTSDGDSISIRECLHMGIPVVASDCVVRPPNCRIFRTLDAEDFARVVKEALSAPQQPSLIAEIDAANSLIAVYSSLLNDQQPPHPARAGST